MAARYFLRRFLLMNARKAATIPCNPAINSASASSLLALAVYGLTHPEAVRACYSQLLAELGAWKESPVFYSLDEHNEIWKRGKQHMDTFRDWYRLDGPWRGVMLAVCVFALFAEM